MTTDERLEKLEEQIENLTRQMDAFEGSAKSAGDAVGKTSFLLGDAFTAMKKISVESAKFAANMQAQYEVGEKLAKVSKQLAVNMGLSVGRSSEFTKVFNRAASQLAKFGGEATDVSNIMERFSNQSGRARIITEEEVLNVFLLEKGLGIADETAAEMMERMDQMGMNAQEANKAITSLVAESQALGLNASKVGKELANNFTKMQTFSFRGGVKGMTEMAKLAVQMRTDVGSMLGMAEKFYEPEAAIEAVANLQMLGGDVAEAFGDPFEVMYLARNKPQELSERVKDMTKNMLQFNETTGEFDMPAEARMQLKSMGDQLGFNVDQMVDIARQSSKIENIKMNVSGNIVDDDMREGIASFAKMDKSGNWVVDLEGKGEIPVQDLNMDDAEKLLSTPQDADEAVIEMAKNSMTTNEILTNIQDSIEKGIVAEHNVYEGVENALRPSMDALFTGTEKTIDRLSEAIKHSPIGEMDKQFQKQIEASGKASAELVDGFFEGLETVFQDNMSNFSWESIPFDELMVKYDVSQKTEKTTDPSQDFLSRNSGGNVDFTTKDDVLGAKKGGVIDKLLNAALGGNNTGGNAGVNSNVNVNGEITIKSSDGKPISNLTAEQLRPIIMEQLNGGAGIPTSNREKMTGTV